MEYIFLRFQDRKLISLFQFPIFKKLTPLGIAATAKNICYAFFSSSSSIYMNLGPNYERGHLVPLGVHIQNVRRSFAGGGAEMEIQNFQPLGGRRQFQNSPSASAVDFGAAAASEQEAMNYTHRGKKSQ
jgi:hypothetical protein